MATLRKRNGKWQVQVRRAGLRNVSRSFLVKADAQRWARDQERVADQGGLARLQKEPPRTTVRELLERYSEQICPNKRAAGANEQIIIRGFLRKAQHLSELLVQEVSSEAFSRYRDLRLAKVSNDTVHREMGILQHAFEIARTEWGHPIPNPISPLRKPQRNRPRDRRLRPDEWSRIRDALLTCRNPTFLPLVCLALETGMRRSELLSIRWNQVDFDHRLLALSRTKNGFPRQVPLSSQALTILRSLATSRTAEGKVFCLTPVAVRQAWDRALTRADIRELHFHDLRHEAISRFFELGLSLPEVALISGHRDPRQLMRYTHLDASRVADKLRHI